MPRPICAKCNREMFVKTNEVLVKDKASDDAEASVWFGDLFECADCGAQIIAGFGKPLPRENAQVYLDEAEVIEFKYD